VICLASGAAGSKEINQGSPAFDVFTEALRKVCTDLATQIVTDGEGATRIFKVSVSGAKRDVDAEKMCREVINSPLVKCAIHGKDPNWGRIVTAAGNAGVWFDTNESSLTIGPVTVYRGGVPVMEALKDPRLAQVMGARSVECELIVGKGPGKWWMIGCDLSAAYVSINADYTT
jgi:glutamate N-acetyltransferase / amino-acid N-acetyltransferase